MTNFSKIHGRNPRTTRVLSKGREEKTGLGNEGFVNNRLHPCGRLISWLNNTEGLCSSFIPIGPWLFLLYDPAQLAAALLVLQHRCPRAVSSERSKSHFPLSQTVRAFSPGEISTVLARTSSSSRPLARVLIVPRPSNFLPPRSRIDRHKLQGANALHARPLREFRGRSFSNSRRTDERTDGSSKSGGRSPGNENVIETFASVHILHAD